MTTTKNDWRTASANEPCPICHKQDWCSLIGPEDSPHAAVCMRIESDNRRNNGGWHHALKQAANSKRSRVTPPRDTDLPAEKTAPTIFRTADAAAEELSRRHCRPPDHRWDYSTANGELAGAVLRWNLPNGKKKIRPIAKTGDGWKITLMPELRPVYRLPELRSAEEVVVCEGEKAADAARSLALVATTSAGGSSAAAKTDWSPLAGKKVIVIPDNDDAGRKYAADVIAQLSQLHPRPEVKLVELPGLDEKGDIFDWVAAGGKREELNELVSETEPEILPENERLDWRPFPTDLLPSPVREFVTEGAATLGCEEAMLAMVSLAALGATIGNTRRLRLRGEWLVPPVIWAAIVSESGNGKTPAFDLALKPLTIFQAREFARCEAQQPCYENDLRQYERMCSQWRHSDGEESPPARPTPPVARRVIVSDTTVEALMPLLRDNPRGILLKRDELAGWFGGFDRYTSRRGADAANWLSTYNGGAVTIDRKTGDPKTISVASALVGIVGTIQPGTLSRQLSVEHRESGLAARLLFVEPPRRSRPWTDAVISQQTAANYGSIFQQLLELEQNFDLDGLPEPLLVQLSPGAKGEYVKYFNRHNEEQTGLTGDLSAAWSKLEETAARIALIFHQVSVANGDSESLVLGDQTMLAAVRLAEWLKRETRRVYGLIDEGPEESQERKLVGWLQNRGGQAAEREVQAGCRWLRESGAAEEALNKLQSHGYGAWSLESSGTKPRRVFRLTPASANSRPTAEIRGNADADAADTADTEHTPLEITEHNHDDEWGTL